MRCQEKITKKLQKLSRSNETDRRCVKMEEKENNNYTEILARRLTETRLSKGISIEQLADTIGVQRQTLNYVESNKEGRSLTVANLIKVANALEVSLDYLLGRVESKSNISNSYDIEEWENNTLGSFDKFMDEIKFQNLPNDLNPYIFVTCVNNNILKEILDKISIKVKSKTELNKAEVAKINFLLEYVEYVCCDKVKYYAYLAFLVQQYWGDRYDTIIKECENLVRYGNGEEVNINFDNISEFKKILEVFEEYLSQTVDRKLKSSKRDMISKIVKDNRYFYNIHRYFEKVRYNS